MLSIDNSEAMQHCHVATDQPGLMLVDLISWSVYMTLRIDGSLRILADAPLAAQVQGARVPQKRFLHLGPPPVGPPIGGLAVTLV